RANLQTGQRRLHSVRDRVPKSLPVRLRSVATLGAIAVAVVVCTAASGLSMDLSQLEYFLRVAELGSINRAAKELGLSQPTLSRSLSRLEHDIGQKLVVRCRTGISITEAGSILASRGLALLREAGAIREELANDPAGRVVIGMPAALRHLVTLPALQAMRSTSPGPGARRIQRLSVR